MDALSRVHGSLKRFRGLALPLTDIPNFVDRGLLSVVAPQMRPELAISGTAFNPLTGFGFALLHTFVRLPLAQTFETRHSVSGFNAAW